MDGPYLILLGFVVGLSGAAIPGPLLVYTIAETVKKGRLTGAYVILGHALVEAALMLVILAGLSKLIVSEFFTTSLSLLGGGFMIFSAIKLYKTPFKLEGCENTLAKGTVVGGILFTALNPAFPMWWATAGARLLLEGFKNAGLFGAGLVLLGHWIADLSYYLLISHLVAKGKKEAVLRYQTSIRGVLSLALLMVGTYFILSAL